MGGDTTDDSDIPTTQPTRWEGVESFLVGGTRAVLSGAFIWLVTVDLSAERTIPVTVYFLLFGIIIGVRPSDLGDLLKVRDEIRRWRG